MCNIQRPCLPLNLTDVCRDLPTQKCMEDWGNTGFKQTEKFRLFKLSVNV